MARFMLVTVLIGVLVSAPFAQAEPNSSSNKWAGFRGLKWGSSINTATKMVLEKDGGDTKIYVREGDALKIGGATLTSIYYEYYKGRLAAVLVCAEGRENWEPLKDAVFANWGEGFLIRQNRYAWTESAKNAPKEAVNDF